MMAPLKIARTEIASNRIAPIFLYLYRNLRLVGSLLVFLLNYKSTLSASIYSIG